MRRLFTLRSTVALTRSNSAQVKSAAGRAGGFVVGPQHIQSSAPASAVAGILGVGQSAAGRLAHSKGTHTIVIVNSPDNFTLMFRPNGTLAVRAEA